MDLAMMTLNAKFLGGLPIHVLDSETLFPPVSTEI